MNSLKLLIISTISVALLLFFLNRSNKPSSPTSGKNQSLTVFCAAGLRLPYDQLADSFEKEFGVKINTEYMGSGHLLAAIELKEGDLFIAADKSYTDIGISKGLVKETLPLAIQYPVIAVQKGNPKEIKGLKDLTNPNIKVSSASPEAASIGKLTMSVYKEVNLWDAFLKNTTDNGTFKPTVNEVANDIKLKSVDAGFVWNAIPLQEHYKDSMDIIEDSKLTAHQEQITAGILTKTKQPTLALKFARYLHASDKGQIVFKSFNYKTIADADQWSEVPEIQLMSGGVNRVVIEKTLEEFEKREGVKITTVYNGCGILVGQMKAGQRPDAYYACDISFTEQVSDLFRPGENIGSTSIVIAVAKDNPFQIKSLTDLTKQGVRIGVGHPEQSALGSLTKKLLISTNLYESISKNIVSEQPGGDMVVVQLVTGSLDAALVYKVNVMAVKDKVQIIDLNIPEATAIQPFSIANKTNNFYTMNRLLDAIKNKNELFQKFGFKFLPKSKN